MNKPISEELQDLEKYMRYGQLSGPEQHACSEKIKMLIPHIAKMEKELKISEAREQDAYASAEIGFISTVEKLEKDNELYQKLCDTATKQIEFGTKKIVSLQNQVQKLQEELANIKRFGLFKEG